MDDDTLQALKEYQEAVAELGKQVLEVRKEMLTAHAKMTDVSENLGKLLMDVSQYTTGGGAGVGHRINLTRITN